MKKGIVIALMAGLVIGLSSCGQAGKATSEESKAATEAAAETLSEGDLPGEGEGEEEFMPSCFVDVASGKEDYESYDEVISYLTDGQAYAYIKLQGYDGDILLVSEGTFDNGGVNAAIDGALYSDQGGKVSCLGTVMSGGTAYPFAVKDGILYTCGNHSFECGFLNPEGAYMIKDYVYIDYDTEGKGVCSGFLRDTNENPVDKEFEGGEEEFYALFDVLEDAEVVSFTVV